MIGLPPINIIPNEMSISVLAIVAFPAVALLVMVLWDARDTDDDREYRKERREAWTVAGLFLTVVLTFGTLLVFLFQLHEMEKVYGPIKDSADAAADSASATLRQVELAEADQRPYIHLLDLRLRKQSPRDPTPAIFYQFGNAGRSAAIMRELNIDCVIIDNKRPEPSYKNEKTRHGRTLIGASTTLQAGFNSIDFCKLEKSLTDIDWDAVERGSKIILFYGFIKYEGVANLTYTKHFAAYYVPALGDGFTDVDDIAFNYESTIRPSVETKHAPFAKLPATR
jgi:hypothetical protein